MIVWNNFKVCGDSAANISISLPDKTAEFKLNKIDFTPILANEQGSVVGTINIQNISTSSSNPSHKMVLQLVGRSYINCPRFKFNEFDNIIINTFSNHNAGMLTIDASSGFDIYGNLRLIHGTTYIGDSIPTSNLIVDGNIYGPNSTAAQFDAGITLPGATLTIDSSNYWNSTNLVCSAASCTGTITSHYFNSTSDRRLKDNIQPFTPNTSIANLPIYEFDYISDGSHHIGCLAQDLQQICPEIVHEDNEGYLQIEESKIVYLLLQEIKELKRRVEELEK